MNFIQTRTSSYDAEEIDLSFLSHQLRDLEIICKFAYHTNLLTMKIVKLNRIKAVLAETGKQGKGLAKQPGKDPATVSNGCTNTIQPDLKTLAEIAELLDVNIRELLVNTK